MYFFMMYRAYCRIRVYLGSHWERQLMGMKNFMAGSKNQSFWMFMRVGCQGITVILLGIGAVMADRQRVMQYAEYSQKRQKSE